MKERCGFPSSLWTATEGSHMLHGLFGRYQLLKPSICLLMNEWVSDYCTAKMFN